jgi:2-oxoglutarate dehydrogenase complex dehydrogenase (E1) component-like enzyme
MAAKADPAMEQIIKRGSQQPARYLGMYRGHLSVLANVLQTHNAIFQRVSRRVVQASGHV